MRKKKNKGKARNQRTTLSAGLGIAFKLLLIVVLIHYTVVLFQGDYHPMFNTAKMWITANVYNGLAAGLVQPVCEKILRWKYTEELFELTGIPALLAAIIIHLFQKYIENITVISVNKKSSRLSWRSGGKYRAPTLSLGRKILYFLMEFYSGAEKNLVREAESMAICRILYDGREDSQDLNTIREWRLDELLQRNGEKMEVTYDRQEKKMTFLLPNGSVKILVAGESFEWMFSDKKCMTVMFL